MKEREAHAIRDDGLDHGLQLLPGTRYDRCGELFLSAICIAATVMFWL